METHVHHVAMLPSRQWGALLLTCVLLVPAAALDLQISGDALHADRVELLGMEFTDLVAEPQLAAGRLRFANLSATAYGGAVRGSIDVNTTDGSLDLELALNDLDLAQFLGRYANIQGLSGRISGQLSLRVPQAQWPRATGEGRLSLSKGSVITTPALATMILGSPSRVSGEDVGSTAFTVRNGALVFRHLAVEDDSFRIVGKGRIHADGRLDLTISPFARLEQLRSVPFLEPARYLLSSLSGHAARFDVTGHISDPRIELSPF